MDKDIEKSIENRISILEKQIEFEKEFRRKMKNSIDEKLEVLSLEFEKITKIVSDISISYIQTLGNMVEIKPQRGESKWS